MSEGTSEKPIPRQIEPRKFAQHGVKLQGSLPAEALERLSGAVVGVKHIHADVVFSMDDQRQKILTGHLDAKVVRQCQRCLEPVDVDLNCVFTLGVVWDEEESRQLSKDIDPWIVTEDSADLYAVLEEEMLLAMPFVSFHAEPCVDASKFQSGPAELGKPEKENPFDVLKKLKK